EAEDLVQLKGVLPVNDKVELQTTLHELVEKSSLRKETGTINANYITQNKGASIKILHHIERVL
ncbi:MAG: 3-deoxy-D-manno-octulosonic acid transferase, partial [Flavobacteriales bacterium]